MNSNPCWQPIIDELDAWQAAGHTATFWWRDDDATEHTPQLDQLNRLSQRYDAPVSLAAIPARLQDSLVHYLKGRHHFSVLQHGYAHLSHAAKSEKKIEIGGQRDDSQIESELAHGFDILTQAFGDQFLPVLVPPWNRIEARCYPIIENAGLLGVSSMWARKVARPVPGLLQVNTHLDPVNWRGDRGMIDQQFAIDQLVLHLYCKRNGFLDAEEPTGILTHHLEQTEAVWRFCDMFFRILNGHPAASWLEARVIWRE